MGEIGGEFAWAGRAGDAGYLWPEDAAWYSLGRDALLAATRQSGALRVWLPSYFCPEASEHLKREGCQVLEYGDNPLQQEPEWGTLEAGAGDAVVAVNYFGVRNGDGWRRWMREHAGASLIEDHTHDPFSEWARSSTATYAFASLRKTLPLPDGSILWSPIGRKVQPCPTNRNWIGSALKLLGMIGKAIYRESESRGSALRDSVLWLLKAGDRRLGGGVSLWTRLILDRGAPTTWRVRRGRNVRQFLNLASGLRNPAPLFREWPEGHCPFNPVLVFDKRRQRDRVRRRLTERGIYCPIHWLQAGDELAGRILTLPLDHRCDERDVGRVWESLTDCLQSC